jgi:hypothetical protein
LTKSLTEQIQNLGIQQLNLAYNQEQDRLLLRVGLSDQTELAVWITYRIAKVIWALLKGETHLTSNASVNTTHSSAQAVEAFRQEAQAVETLQKLDFSTEYQPREVSMQHGHMLAVKASLVDEPSVKALDLTCIEGVNLRLSLNQEIILALCNMLQLTNQETGWSLGGLVPSATLVVTASDKKQVLH